MAMKYHFPATTQIRILVLCALFAVLYPKETCAYCFMPGENPRFRNDPKITQISAKMVRVSWKGIVDDLRCADKFFVRYWRPKKNGEERKSLGPISKPTDHVDVEVLPNKTYYFKVNAHEDKGWRGTEDNWSNLLAFRTATPVSYTHLRAHET